AFPSAARTNPKSSRRDTGMTVLLDRPKYWRWGMVAGKGQRAEGKGKRGSEGGRQKGRGFPLPLPVPIALCPRPDSLLHISLERLRPDLRTVDHALRIHGDAFRRARARCVLDGIRNEELDLPVRAVLDAADADAALPVRPIARHATGL